MAAICITPPRSVSILLWVLFASSFLWFPFIGMSTLPCRRKAAVARSHGRADVDPRGAINYANIAPLSSANATVGEVMEDQRKRMESFCTVYNGRTTVYDEAAVQDLYHHILVDDERKMIFCYVPKVGCSNWKRVFLILAGVVDPSEKMRPSIEIFRQVNSLLNYTPKEQEFRLRHYFKFMFVRHPPERVLSAYRNKIEHPFASKAADQNLWDDIRLAILSSYRMNFNNKMIKNKDIYPSFAEFIHFLYDSDVQQMNEHYKPMVELCQPCAVKYDFVGNFATLRQDADAVLEHLHIINTYFWDRGKHMTTPTDTFVRDYYSKLMPIDLKRLEERYGEDINFYKYLFSVEGDGGYANVRESIMKAEGV